LPPASPGQKLAAPAPAAAVAAVTVPPSMAPAALLSHAGLAVGPPRASRGQTLAAPAGRWDVEAVEAVEPVETAEFAGAVEVT